MFRLRLSYALIAAVCVSAPVAFADTIFTDSTFNLSNYTATAANVSDASVKVKDRQCASCGDPGQALVIATTLPKSVSEAQTGAIGLVDDLFSYDPLTAGAITSIDVSVDKNLFVFVNVSGSISNAFYPLIEQDGNYYMASISGPTAEGGGATGFLDFSGTALAASDFVLYNFVTGTFETGSPNFDGDPMLFGLGQISSVDGDSKAAWVKATYDNLDFDLHTVPLPEAPSAILLIAGVGLLCGAALVRRLKAV